MLIQIAPRRVRDLFSLPLLLYGAYMLTMLTS